MRTLTVYGAPLLAVALAALTSSACGPTGPSAGDLNNDMNGGTGATSGSTSTPTAGTSVGGNVTSAGTGNTAGTGPAPTGGSGGSGPMGGSGGSDATGGTGPMGGTGGTGEPVTAYSPRTGSFKMLVLTRTKGYRHAGSIDSGKVMLEQIAQEQGFELTFAGSAVKPGASDQEIDMLSGAEIDAAITAENLAKYEIIFHLNTTGDVFNNAQQQIYEDWMTQHNGAFAGVHSATDTENGWAFYSDVTGQYYNGHGAAGTPDQIKLEANMLSHAALKGIPNPWQRNEEWYKFDQWQAWSAKPGFQILGKKNADSQPIMWVREFGNFRAFYTALGHDSVAFQDANVKKHVTGGIMWAVRREALVK
jgi:type 1 glutamine amidotransferase